MLKLLTTALCSTLKNKSINVFSCPYEHDAPLVTPQVLFILLSLRSTWAERVTLLIHSHLLEVNTSTKASAYRSAAAG